MSARVWDDNCRRCVRAYVSWDSNLLNCAKYAFSDCYSSMVPAIRGSFNAMAAVALGMILYGWSMCRQVDLTWVCFVSVSESMCGY